MDICDIRRRSGGGNVVEVGAETVSPGMDIDRCVLAGDHRSVDRRSLRLMPSPAGQESEQGLAGRPRTLQWDVRRWNDF